MKLYGRLRGVLEPVLVVYWIQLLKSVIQTRYDCEPVFTP